MFKCLLEMLLTKMNPRSIVAENIYVDAKIRWTF